MKRIVQFSSMLVTGSLLIAVGFGLAIAVFPMLDGGIASANNNLPPMQITGSPTMEEQQAVFSEIYNTVGQAVVSINVAARNRNDGEFQNVSAGSGFVIDKEGHIVTNFHVVAFPDVAERIDINMFDGTIAQAEIVGLDPDSDLAVIRAIGVPEDRFFPVTFADSNALEVGQVALALGNPFGNDFTMTSGIISALNRSIRGLNRFSIGGVIQTDTAINPGNSGGPLLNMNGEVIGVNSQIQSEGRFFSGIGFAVPSNLTAKVAEALIEDGEMVYSFLGIQTFDSFAITFDLIEEYNLPNNLRGVPVFSVEPGTPASEGGLRTAGSSLDVITAINGTPVDDFDELIGYLGINTNPGDTVTMDVYRDGNIIQTTVTLGARR